LNEDVQRWIDALELRSRRKLSGDEAAAIACLPIRRRQLAIDDHFSREGDPSVRCAYVLEGTLYQAKLTRGGDRQIIGLRLPHEFVGLQDILLQTRAHDVQALTPCRLLEVDAGQLRSILGAHPGITEILMADVMISCSIAQDWIVNVGRRDAQSRVAHLLCELALRMKGSALSPGASYVLPLTQLQIGDAVGLGRIAVNRVMRDLAQLGVVSCDKSFITILDPVELEDIGDFTARYLHLGQSERERRKSDRGTSIPGFSSPAPRDAIASDDGKIVGIHDVRERANGNGRSVA
jgi:CRP-like cAMP-binding protein